MHCIPKARYTSRREVRALPKKCLDLNPIPVPVFGSSTLPDFFSNDEAVCIRGESSDVARGLPAYRKVKANANSSLQVTRKSLHLACSSANPENQLRDSLNGQVIHEHWQSKGRSSMRCCEMIPCKYTMSSRCNWSKRYTLRRCWNREHFRAQQVTCKLQNRMNKCSYQL